MKNTLFSSAALVAVALSVTGLAQAQDGPPQRGPGGPPDGGPGGRMGPPPIEDVDTDKSGDVSEEEFTQFLVKQAEERAAMIFGRLDANQDGKLTGDEMARPPRDGQGPPRGQRDGDGGPRGPRDGDRGPRGPRDGDGGAPSGPGDGDAKRPPLEGAN